MHDLSVDTLFCFDYVVLKYIGYYAELPVGLPKTLEDHIVAKVQVTPHSQGSLIRTICVSFNLNIHNAIYIHTNVLVMQLIVYLYPASYTTECMCALYTSNFICFHRSI